MTSITKIDLKLDTRESIFDGKTLKEIVNVKKLERLIRNPQLLIIEEDNGFDERTQLKNYLKKIKNGNEVLVKYGRSKDIGRVYSEKSLSYQCIRKEVRHTLTDNKYMDLDMINGHPTILNQICKMNGLGNGNLDKYCNDREKYLNMIMNVYGVSKGQSKNLFIRIMYLGTVDNWIKDLDLENKKVIPFLKNFQEEMKQINSIISCMNREHLDNINKSNKKKKITNYGCYFMKEPIKREDKESFLPYYLQEQENRILEVVYQYLRKHNYLEGNIGTLCYDGIMLMKTENVEELLIELNKVVMKETGLDIKFLEKPLNEGFKESDFKEEIDTEDKEEVERMLNEKWNEYCSHTDLNEEELEDFDNDFFENTLGKLEYPLNFTCMKKYFLDHYIYIMKENSFYEVRRHFIYDRKRNKQIKIELEEVPELGLNKFLVETTKGKEPFIKLLTKEGFKKYKSIKFDPISLRNKNYYNIFTGFGYTHIDTEPTEEERTNFKKYLDYILNNVCENDLEQYNYFMSFLSNIIKEPDFKPHICYIFYSNDKGTGKSSFCKLLRKIYGMTYTFIGNVRVIFNTHSTSNEYSFLNILEELDKKMGNETYEQLKDKIQCNYVNINRKFKQITELQDYTRYIITTNDYNSLRLDRNHRRFCLLNFELTEDKELLKLFNEVYEINSNVYVKLFGEYLKNFNITMNSRDEWIRNRKSSNKLKLFLKVEKVEEFLIGLYRNDLIDLSGNVKDNTFTITQTNLYTCYKEQYEKKFVKNRTNFKTDIKNFGFVKSRKSSCMVYDFDLKKMFKYLNENDLIEEEEYENKHLD